MSGTVTAGDGHGVGYQIREPDGDATTTVVFLPALGVPLSYYTRLLDAWAAAGRRVVGVEHRGMPLSPTAGIRRGRFGYRDMIRQDLPAIFGLDAVRDGGRVVLAGHSMGGALALLAAGARTVTPDAVVTVATGTSWCAGQDGALRRVQRHAGVRVVRAVTRTLGYWPGHRLGFAGRQPSTVMRDWAYEASHGRFRLQGDPFDYEAALAGLTVPVLMLGVDGDQWLTPRAVALLARRAAGADKMQIRVRDDVRVDHFTWARRAPGDILEPIEQWLSRLSPSR